MLVLSRRDLAANLAAYGEAGASARLAEMPESDFKRVCEIGFRNALDGESFAKASSLAAVEVLEGKQRELRRQRRVWSDVPPELLNPDRRTLEIDAWFDRYSGGAPVRKPEILQSVSGVIGARNPEFRYFKTAHQFRRLFSAGTAYIGLEYAKGVMALRFGTHIESVERVKERLFSTGYVPHQHHPHTISKYTYNMGPRSRRWAYPTETTWPILGSEGLQLATLEIVDFIEDVVVPYLSRHEDPLAVRETLIHNPGQADAFAFPEKTVFAVDVLSRRRDWLDSDYGLFAGRASGHVESLRNELRQVYERAVAHAGNEV
jgi:hypothetical protein